MTAMPPMPGKERKSERPVGDESEIYGGGVRSMRANIAKLHGFGPMLELEPTITRGERNWITPAGVPNFTRMSRNVRDLRYSGGYAAERVAPLIKEMREREARELNSLDWGAVIEWTAANISE